MPHRSASARSASATFWLGASSNTRTPPDAGGAALGIVNGVVTCAGALYQPMLGWLLDLAWTGEMAGGACVYTVTAYSTAFSVLVAGAVVGIACTLLMRETECRESA